MSGLDNLSVKIFAVVGVISALLFCLKKLATEFETVAVAWIRVYRRLKNIRKDGQ